MKIPTLILAISSVIGMNTLMPLTFAQTLEQSIFESHHNKMRRQRSGELIPHKTRPAWKNRTFKSTPHSTYAQIKTTAPILMWNISRENPGFNSLRVIGEASPGEQVRVSGFKEQGLVRVFFMRRGIKGWVKEDNLLIQ